MFKMIVSIIVVFVIVLAVALMRLSREIKRQAPDSVYRVGGCLHDEERGVIYLYTDLRLTVVESENPEFRPGQTEAVDGRENPRRLSPIPCPKN